MVKASLASAIGCVLCAGVAIHEWAYHQAHHYAPGVSGVLTVLAIGGALTAGAVTFVALNVENERSERARRELLAARDL